jgi:hypothetical protein
MRAILLVFVCATAVAQTVTVESRDLSQRPPSPVLRERNPDQVPRLPAQVRANLAAKHCKIPLYRGSSPSSDEAVSSGRFHTDTATDWAVICHVPELKSQDVLVYTPSPNGWGAERIEHGTFDPAPQADKCEETVGAASPLSIREHTEHYAPEDLRKLPPLAHQGVEVGICEKASVVYFYSAGHWLTLQGAD